MINRWRAKIDWKEGYYVRDPQKMRDREKGEKKGEDNNNWRDFGNLYNLALKKEESLSSSDEAPEDTISRFSLYPSYPIHV